ncbi:hypothetical protein [Parasphingopyxis marina]|uniref:Uncharacterized protein n=1 Tax=Parasphingopyxis marina TaxID=2761622 RepID=A0A842HY64_9SPHN|nr:hypothetical protein [Parasphingopyxis marina]MBC2777387.1 hypothetical protein [Parasphingopyxis marina]
MRRTATACCALALGLAAPMVFTLAVATPPPPPFRAAYGPMPFCGEGFVIDVTEAEAIGWRPQGSLPFPSYTLRSGSREFFVQPFRSDALHSYRPFREYAEGRAEEIELEGLGTVLRFPLHFEDIDINSRLRTVYVVDPEGMPDGFRLALLSPDFEGSERDLELIRRVRAGAPEALGCGEPTFESREFAIAAAMDGGALASRPIPVPGPIFLCSAGWGFAVEEGERVTLPWNVAAGIFYLDDGRVRLSGGNWLRAPEPRLGRMVDDPRIAVERRGGAGADMSGPRSYALFRTDTSGYGRSTVTFTGEEAAEGDRAFLSRIELIETGDERCFPIDDQ